MEGLLIKVDDVYRLIHEYIIVGTTDSGYQQAFSDHCSMLSIENCEEINTGLDLDKLAEDYANSFSEDNGTSSVDFKAGALKIIELLRDKKFTESDIHRAYESGERQDRYDLGEIIDSVDEWGVTFDFDAKDADGCLILKLID